ncbi:MAG TPA: DUF2103 domain-containing protein [Candidatus Paceibacterota bacterium]
MSKHSRSGGKFTGNHTTLIPAATIVCDVADACPSVTKIAPDFIKAGLRSVNGQRRVKITEKNGAILLSVRDNASHQYVYVYTKDVQAAKLAIARGARNEGLIISFGGMGGE